MEITSSGFLSGGIGAAVVGPLLSCASSVKLLRINSNELSFSFEIILSFFVEF